MLYQNFLYIKSVNLKQYPYGIQKFNSELSSEQKIDKNVTSKRVSN